MGESWHNGASSAEESRGIAMTRLRQKQKGNRGNRRKDGGAAKDKLRRWQRRQRGSRNTPVTSHRERSMQATEQRFVRSMNTFGNREDERANPASSQLENTKTDTS